MNDILIGINRYYQNLDLLVQNPTLIKNILRVYLGKLFKKKNLIRQVEIAIGYECNAKCEQCSCAKSLDKKRKRLSINQFKRLIDESINLGAFQFNITGGEPLLYFKETKELIRYINYKKCYSHLCTNSILLNKNRLTELKKLGLNSIEFGFDSANPKVHNDNRNAHAYENVLFSTKLARSLNVKVIWDTIITPQKIRNGDLMAVIKLAKIYGAMVQITPPCLTGKWNKNKSILLSEDDKKYFKKVLKIRHVRTDTFSSFLNPGCPAAREKLAVNPYGDVLPCSLIQITYGNFLKQSLSDIQKEMLKEPYYKGGKGILSCLPSFDEQFISMFMKQNSR